MYFLKFTTNIEEKESWKSSFKWKWKKWGGGSEGSEPRNVFMKDSVLCLSKYSAGRLYTKGRAQEISLCWPKNFAQLLPQVTTPSGVGGQMPPGDHTLRWLRPQKTTPSGHHALRRPLPRATTPSSHHTSMRSHPLVSMPPGDHTLRRPLPQETMSPRRLHLLVARTLRRPHPLVATPQDTTPSGDHALRRPHPQVTPSFRILLAFIFYTWKSPALSITRV